MSNAWCVSHIKARDELYPLYKAAYPEDKSNIVIGQQVGQITRFLCEIQAGDYVMTPAADTEWLHYGKVGPDPSYYFAPADQACPFPHRRHVEWSKDRLKRGDFSVAVPAHNSVLPYRVCCISEGRVFCRHRQAGSCREACSGAIRPLSCRP